MPKTVTATTPLGEEHKVPVSELQWRPSAYGFVLKDGNLLLSKQFAGYDLPGGGLDLGETPEQAVLREIKEETGIDAAAPRLLAVASTYFILPNRGAFQSVMLYYQCDFVGGEFSIEGFDEYEKEYADMPEWIPLKKVQHIEPASSNDFRQYVNLLEL